MLFASAGHQVRLYDVVPEALAAAPGHIREILTSLEAKGQLKPSKLSVDEQVNLISGTAVYFSVHKNMQQVMSESHQKHCLHNSSHGPERGPERCYIHSGKYSGETGNEACYL